MNDSKKISRRKFLLWSAAGAATASTTAFLLNLGRLFDTPEALNNDFVTVPQDYKQVFSKCGACSNTFFTILNREFGYPDNTAELAADPLAGGIMNAQHQCGMLWGSSLAVGAESFRRFSDYNRAMAMAIIGTQGVMKSYIKRTKSVNCRDVVGVEITNGFDLARFMAQSLPSGFSNMVCLNLAEAWAPEATQAAKEGLLSQPAELPELPVSCASEVARILGAGEKEQIMVAGFAGGLGLSGNSCGALASAIWLSSLKWCKENPGKSGYENPHAKEIFKVFNDTTGNEMLCSKLSGRRFNTIGEHTEFINNSGCDNLISMLAGQAAQ